jgi:parallel beta-helix repeat protein
LEIEDRVNRIFKCWLPIFWLILVLIPACGSAEEAKNEILIKASSSDYGKDINKAIHLASPKTRIIFGAGSYHLENPIVISKSGIHIIGRGRESTFFSPKNPGKPIFIFRADNIVIKGITVDAQIINGSGMATFAVQIEKGFKKFEISEMKISGSGASSIIAPQANNITINNNIITNAGDDAIQIRGSDLKIIDNIIIRYFDEGIDVAKGENIIVKRNYLESGRIGIVLDDCSNAFIGNNIVKEHLQQGIVMASKEEGNIIGNIVINSRQTGFNLFSPSSVDSNWVTGNHHVGLNIYNMNGGTIKNNTILDCKFGIKIYNSTKSLFIKNKYCIENKPLVNEMKKSHANTIYDNISVCSETGVLSEAYFSKTLTEKRADLIKEVKKITLDRSNSNARINVDGSTNQDKQIANDIAKFLMNNNPGFLSIKVNSDTMTSGITDELYNILKGGGQLAIGVVRWPYLMFKWRSISWFPVWHLNIEGQEVALITYTNTGANVRIYFKKNGKLGLKNSLIFLKNYCSTWIEHFYKKLTKKLKKLISKIQ